MTDTYSEIQRAISRSKVNPMKGFLLPQCSFSSEDHSNCR